MLEENENDGEFDRYCGYVPLSQSEEATGHCLKSPDTLANIKAYEGRPYRVHTKQPVPEGSPYSLYSLQPMQSKELRDPSSYRTVSDRGTSSQHTRQPVSKESPYSRPIRTLVSEETQYLPRRNPILASESSLPDEYGAEIKENFANTSMGRQLSYTSLPFLNEGNLDGYEEDADFGDDYLKSNDGEIESEKFENGKVVFGKSDCGKIDNIDYDKGVKYDNVDDAMGTASYDESSEGDDSEEEELIVIDSDTDDSEIVGELSQKDYKYCEYPVGKCNTVIVSEKDYRSLECSKFLNDIIIDFYLNYIFLHVLPVEHQSTVHVFSTLFYKRLLQVPKKKRKSANFEEDPTVPMAQKRHRRVSGWTKNVDLFSKSVLLIPICENSHWYLLMVIGLTSETPFILVLDSLGGLRKRAARIIRQYLACEYEAKQIKGKRGFSDAHIPSIRPAKPEQPNCTDCGVYLLHYAEKIFKSISHFLSPHLPCLRNWFTHEEVEKNRSHIALLIRKLAKEQKPHDDDFQFPDIPFALEKDPEMDEEMDMDVEEVKNVDDFINRLDNLMDNNSVKSSEKAKGTGVSESSEMMKTSSSRKRGNRKITGNISCNLKTSSLSSSTSRGLSVPGKNLKTELVPSKTSSLSIRTSRVFLVPDINPKPELVPPPKNRKSHSGGYKIPRMKNSECSKTPTAVTPKEPVQPRRRSFPTQASNDKGKSGIDSITGKLKADEPKFPSPPGNSISEIEMLTATSCPVYGDRCEGIYHSHPKAKNLSKTSRNGGNSIRSSLGNDWKSGVSNVNRLDDQYPPNLGLKKSNIVDMLLTDASETSNT